MKKNIVLFIALIMGLCVSCSDELELRAPHATNITFSELEIPERFSHVIPEDGFAVAGMKFNTVKEGKQLKGGFCFSNRSNRSFVWNNDEQSMDSIRYSVWSTYPNQTGTYLVCHVNGDDAYFTIDNPQVIDYILIANTTWDFLCITYGDTYGTAKKPVANPNVPSAPKGVWSTYVEGGVRAFGNGDALEVIATGYLNGNKTGEVRGYLACMLGYDNDNPKYNFITTDWRKMEMSELGIVDKVVFHMKSTDVDSEGRMRTPAWFCIDGLQFLQ
ncbi:MAG: DUF4465 domain-containing protein [Prevotella sp.]